MKKLALLLSLLALAAVGLAACGDDEETTSADTAATTPADTTAADTGDTGGSGGTVSFEADPGGQLAYTETEVTATAGPNTIEFDNPASLGHDVVIEDDGGSEVARTDVITGETTTTDADLEAGTYTFYCSVPGHRDAGMEGTLTVK